MSKKRLPELVKVEWENGDITFEIPVLDINDVYQFNPQVNGNVYAPKSWCTSILKRKEKIQRILDNIK